MAWGTGSLGRVQFEIRTPAPEEMAAFREAVGEGFSEDIREGDEHAERFERVFGQARLLAAYDDDLIVGTYGAFPFEMAVPGGTMRTAGTTIVTTRPTHRRSGVTTSLMRRHLDEAVENGESMAALWASETSIYGRFGYGLATFNSDVSIETDRGAFREGAVFPGRARLVSLDEAKQLIPPLYERLWRERPGSYGRTDEWWDAKWFHDDPDHRGGATAYKYVVNEVDGDTVAYARYRVKHDWGPFPNYEVKLDEIQGVDGAARLTLWRYLLDIDLVTKVSSWNQPTDLELPWALAEHRRLLQRRSDALWVRILDVAGALGGRAYRASGSLVISVEDRFRPQTTGRYRLDMAGDGTATCRPTDDPADIEMEIGALGSLYLGGVPARDLADAGLISGSPQVVELADRAFGWGVAPYCPEVF